MSEEVAALIDTRDMTCVHDAFRRAFADAPGQLAGIEEGDVERAQTVAGYLGDVLWLLDAHHDGEDELLYPLLVARAPENDDVYTRMERQHAAVVPGIEAAQKAAERFGESASGDDREALADACRSLLGDLAGHLAEEEAEVCPVASRVVTAEEWGALPSHVMSQYAGTRPWLLFGLVFESMPDQLRDHVLASVPPPVSEMWFGWGLATFNDLMRSVRGGS
jgi:hemerythrin-like domain-containing protein